MMKANKISISVLLSIAFMLSSQSIGAFSILTHEAIIDACWEKSIQPLLELKYPQATGQQLKEAHAYAYGGSIAPDMGYFPLGNVFFTDLVHYVRSGDFVTELLDEEQNINEYAFSLGFLSHYMTDKYGHSLATNLCVPIVYPKEKRKYGDIVTYAEDHISHKRMEFGFDVLQTVKGNYATEAYHDFIGFQVSRNLLERAFKKIYGLDINDLFGNFALSIESFRWSFKKLFPTLTNAAWVIKKNEMLKSQSNVTTRDFAYRMRKADYDNEFGKKGRKPGVVATFLSFLIRVLPKIGPLRALKFKDPGPVAEKLFIHSFDTILIQYKLALKNCASSNIDFANIDFDTGNITSLGEYPLADKTYNSLLTWLRKQDFEYLNDSLKKNIIEFYAPQAQPGDTGKAARIPVKTSKTLERLRQAKSSS
jgi:Zinc dependent phospholipase C